MTRAKGDLHLLVLQPFLSMGKLQGAIALCMRRARALSPKRCCRILKRSPGQRSQRLGLLRPVRHLKWISRRICGACGVKRSSGVSYLALGSSYYATNDSVNRYDLSLQPIHARIVQRLDDTLRDINSIEQVRGVDAEPHPLQARIKSARS